MQNAILYAVPALIWGTTWFAITFQLGKVDPLVSVFYRFALASLIMFAYCFAARINLRYRLKDHVFIALQGVLLFGINYWLVYLAEVYVTSGLVAIMFCSIALWNIFNGALFLGAPVRLRMVLGAALGLTGMALIFNNEILSFSVTSGTSLGLLFGLISAYSASVGNIISARNHQYHLPVIPTTAYAMLYGTLFVLGLSLILGKPFAVNLSWSYLISLVYLAIFGSVVAFSCYLKLIGTIGADKAGYVGILNPMIALGFSTFFENYHWTTAALLGVAFVLSGNVLILKKQRALMLPQRRGDAEKT